MTAKRLFERREKNGDFILTQEIVDQLRGLLAKEEVISLYLSIRDESMRLEDEWRAGSAGTVEQAEPLDALWGGGGDCSAAIVERWRGVACLSREWAQSKC
ncbi:MULTISPECIES: hypothetical protein [Pseudomonas]|jgi:hypothetical protein|uniref:hypothetical protein n=1 Tax=Pseudomonas TaxID=286 RepID=UPI00285CAE40|nr:MULTISPECIES: hypothetical protein [Pseudomonas]MDR6926152.1 hypothetical protein [Pseudomonas sp. BE134]MDR7286228.1 hypothetical protein [Pseudomonas corrugata]